MDLHHGNTNLFNNLTGDDRKNRFAVSDLTSRLGFRTKGEIACLRYRRPLFRAGDHVR